MLEKEVVSALLEGIAFLKAKSTNMEEKMNYMQGDIVGIKRRLDVIDERLDGIDKRFDEVPTKEEMNKRFDQVGVVKFYFS